jgi:hypothetical protein
MTTKIHNEYLRTDSIKNSANRKYRQTTFSARVEPADELYYTDVLNRIELLDESFDDGDMTEDHSYAQTAYDFTDSDGAEDEHSWH